MPSPAVVPFLSRHQARPDGKAKPFRDDVVPRSSANLVRPIGQATRLLCAFFCSFLFTPSLVGSQIDTPLKSHIVIALQATRLFLVIAIALAYSEEWEDKVGST